MNIFNLLLYILCDQNFLLKYDRTNYLYILPYILGIKVQNLKIDFNTSGTKH